ncbi:MAG: hypothetical protein EBZ29_11235 [Synechococcaceae bacterium WB9_4xC_028]|nr:hypothetical protein [Synechococcaceae bacterium WB9_4xC_028]
MGVVNRCAIGVRARYHMRVWAQEMEPEAPLIDDLHMAEPLRNQPTPEERQLLEELLREIESS